MIAGDNGIEVASPANCDAIDTFTSADGSSAALTPEDEAQMRQWCVAAYEAAGRFGDAYRFAVEVLSSSPANAQVRAEAEAAALRNPEACADSDRLAQLVGLGADGDRFASFLLNCMAAAQAPEATDTLAQLQVTFLTEFPDRAEAPAVEAALTANYSGCALLDDLRTTPATSNRPGFIATMTLSCAQVAEFVQDYDSAVEWYQWFIDNAPLDERVVTANDGLARSLIKRAQLAGAGELPAPNDTGSSGTSAVRIVIYNDSPEDLNIVMSGPESRFEFVSASPTSSTYPLVGPPSCRTDVPVIEFDVPAGQYQVLVEAASGSVDGFVGTWTLGRGDEYTSCFFIVTTFG